MMSHPPSLAREIDAALAFWRAAGVDCDFADNARAWLADPVETGLAAPQPPPGKERADAPSEPVRTSRAGQGETASPASPRRELWGDSQPESLEAFRHWWLTSRQLGAGTYPRIAARGQAGARLMVLVPDPEHADTSQLLSGPQGRLLANILGAAGLAPDDCYIASALPRHTPMADLASLAASGLDRVTAHHIALAAPQRILAFGKGLDAFVMSSARAAHQPLREINQDELSPPFMITETLESMLHMPNLKARFWRRWMEWSA